MMNGRIYIIRNSANSKCYVGQTIGPIADRLKRHIYNALRGDETALCRAIKKYGPKRFSVSLLAECDVSFLCELERHYIRLLGTFPGGYNMDEGGGLPPRRRGWTHTEEWKKHNSLVHTGMKRPSRSAEFRAKQSLAQSGKTIPSATRAKISVALKGRKKPARTADHVNKILLSQTKENGDHVLKGRPWSQARRDAENKRKRGQLNA